MKLLERELHTLFHLHTVAILPLNTYRVQIALDEPGCAVIGSLDAISGLKHRNETSHMTGYMTSHDQ